MYQAVTHGIKITVDPEFDETQSRPEDNYFLWAYTVEIINVSTRGVRLNSRVWQITDANGRVDEVRGDGVVGQTPHIAPGDSFSYTSGCPLKTPSGIMVGSYQMTTDDGEDIDVDVPAFSLDCKYAVRSVN